MTRTTGNKRQIDYRGPGRFPRPRTGPEAWLNRLCAQLKTILGGLKETAG